MVNALEERAFDILFQPLGRLENIVRNRTWLGAWRRTWNRITRHGDDNAPETNTPHVDGGGDDDDYDEGDLFIFILFNQIFI